MDNCLKVMNIIKEGNKIEILYESNGKWNELMNLNEHFFSEYDVNIEGVPNSISVIPFICNILPIAWVFNLSINIDELDEEFYNCLDDVKLGYANMYPNIEMRGNIIVNRLVKNEYQEEKSAALFSGGVDAFNTLINHVNEKPDLLTVWGADVPLSDTKGWEEVKRYNELIKKQWDLNFYYIKTNCCTFVKHAALSKFVYKKEKAEWWHDFQHGICLLGLIFPYAFINKYGTLYIASSFTESMKGKYTCASDPTIDNYLKFANCKVIHDGYEFSRQDKIHNICEFQEKNKEKKEVLLRVCWESLGREKL